MWPKLSNIEANIAYKIKNRNNVAASTLNCWVRVISGANAGLIFESHPDYPIFSLNGEASVYGNSNTSGTVGSDWNGKIVSTKAGRALRPRPIITGLTVKEGHDQISREVSLKIKCFTLEQLELIQEYFMEPGYTLCIEFGWNTPNASWGIIDRKKILSDGVTSNLNQNKLHEKRIKSNGDYDSFLGFIVGGNINNADETYDVEVSLRGSPSLPTFMQSHNLPLKQDGNGDINLVTNNTGPYPYPSSESEDEDATALDRRFKAMFNDLPTFRQTQNVKDILTDGKVKITELDFINFDKVVSNSVNSFAKPAWYKFWKSDEVDVKSVAGDIPLEKDKLFSTNRYIRLELAVAILNRIGVIEAYTMGNESIDLRIDISNSVIGAFPKIFSTKADKLLIAGNLPEFSKYFLNVNDVSQQELYDSNFIGLGVPFVETIALTPKIVKGYNEEAEHWGYLKNLYVNFDMFKNKIEQKNKNIREIFLDILNEMSSAVNSYWNFQIVEMQDENGNISKEIEINAFSVPMLNPMNITNPIKITQLESTKTTIRLGVIDENWIGKPSTAEPIHTFYHNGANCTFLESNLELSIPGEMTNQIVSRRLDVVTNPDTPITDVGGFFNASVDLFLKEVVAGGSDRTATTENAASAPPPEEDKTLEDLKKAKEDLKITTKTESFGVGSPGITAYYDEDGTTASAESVAAYKAIEKEISAKVKETGELQKTTLTKNLDKLDVVPNPSINTPLALTDGSITAKDEFNKNFIIYCFNDTSFFDKIKNKNFFLKKPTDNLVNENGGVDKRLSQPLPIKYSFKILGTSGLRRGDMFNIIGIPAKYAKYGLFQITQVEHTIENMNWFTEVKGEYRQIQ